MPPKYATICPRPCKLTFDLLTLKVVSESRVTWATFSKPVLVFLGLSVLDLGPMYATDRRQTDVRRASSLNAPYPRGGGIINKQQKTNRNTELPSTKLGRTMAVRTRKTGSVLFGQIQGVTARIADTD